MPSIPAAGLAKALIVVTVSLHPGAAHHDPGSYTVRPGDTLAAIAARAYGNAADWPAVWQANRRQVPDPADRRGPAGPRRPGHRRLARVRSKGLTPPGLTCPPPGFPSPGAGK